VTKTMTLTLAFAFAAALIVVGEAAANDWKLLTADDGLPSNEIQMIHVTDDGVAWIGTLQGLVRIEDGEVSDPVVKGQVYDVLLQDDQTLVGTNRGVMRLQRGEQTTELKGKLVAPLVEFSPGRPWALQRVGGNEAANASVVEYVSGGWRPVEALGGRSAVGLQRSDDGRVWVILEGDGVAMFDPKTGVTKFEHLLKGQNVTTMFVDSKGQAWFGLWDAGVTMYDGQAWHDHLREHEIYTNSIRETNNGEIWIATGQVGLFRFDGKQWTNLLRDEGGVNLLETTSDGRLWICTHGEGGLRYRDGDRWVTAIEGPLPMGVMAESPDGTLWVGGVLDGLRVRPTQTDEP